MNGRELKNRKGGGVSTPFFNLEKLGEQSYDVNKLMKTLHSERKAGPYLRLL